uniref:Uncharacterized protein n=1 Tax=Rhizophora mucronata TaxID=61149 RepID=A0A2P2NTQ3_RHIMU
MLLLVRGTQVMDIDGVSMGRKR